MNERIKELALQAGFAMEVGDPNSPPSWWGAGHNNRFEKFAELIVREWLRELDYTVLDTQELRRDKSTDYQVGWEDGMFDAGEKIKYIFGVEE